MQIKLLLSAVLCAIAIGWLEHASAEDGVVSRKARTVVYLGVVTNRGEQCGLLKRWEAEAIRAQMREEMKNWDTETHAYAAEQVSLKSAETACDDDSITVWIDAAQPNLRAEALPPYLIAYRRMAKSDEPPAIFRALALDLDQRPILSAIDSELNALSGSDARPEGGGNWDDYIVKTEGQLDTLFEAFSDAPKSKRYTAQEAAALLGQAVYIVRTWYHETQTDVVQ